MMIQELFIGPCTKDKAASAHLIIDKTEYVICTCGSYVNVYTGRAIRLRTAGKCFWNVEEIATHYKKHGPQLLEYARKLLCMCPAEAL